MARGGARPGAGRRKGARNKRTEEQEAAVKATGLTPLEYLTSVFQNEANDDGVRIDAAKAAAPYCHAKLASIEVTGADGEAIEYATTIKLVGVMPNDDG